METPDANPRFQYFISEKAGIAIVTWLGLLNTESIPELERCATAILETKAKIVILHLREVGPKIDRTVLRPFTQLQKQVREMPAKLMVVGIHPRLSSELSSHGVLRPEEVGQNLQAALKKIVQGK